MLCLSTFSGGVPMHNEAAEILGVGKATIQRAYKELQDKGFLVLEREGNWYRRRAHEWRLTTKPVQTRWGKQICKLSQSSASLIHGIHANKNSPYRSPGPLADNPVSQTSTVPNCSISSSHRPGQCTGPACVCLQSSVNSSCRSVTPRRRYWPRDTSSGMSFSSGAATLAEMTIF